MRRLMTLTALALGAALPAFAQDGEWVVEVEATVAGSAVEDETPLAPASDGVLASGRFLVTRSDAFDSGLIVTWRGEVRLERDALPRPAFVGVLGDCPAASPLCPRVASGGGFLSPISPATGLSADGVVLDEQGFAAVEAASVAFESPWGEAILGLDSGAAARLDARAPTVLNRVSAFSSGLDPSGVVTTRARNDVTASSPKITYLSPRWLGLRVGASYTPEANDRSADFDPDRQGTGLASADLEQVWEGGVSFARQFAEQNLRVRAAVTYSSANSGSGLPAFGDYEAWGAGLELEHQGWTGGVRWLSSNNAWNSGNADYEAWEAGLVHQWDEWRVGVEGGWSEDGLTGQKGDSWLFGASKKVNDNLDVGVAWTSADVDLPVLAGGSLGHINARNDGVILELTVRN